MLEITYRLTAGCHGRVLLVNLNIFVKVAPSFVLNNLEVGGIWSVKNLTLFPSSLCAYNSFKLRGRFRLHILF
jgi:hypothetical protein